ERVGDELRKKDGEGIADGETQGAERVVVLLAQETRLKHERRSKKNGQPQEAWTEFARLFGSGADGEAEKDEHHKDEDNGGREELARSEFGAKFLAEQDRSVGEKAHGGGQALPKVRIS